MNGNILYSINVPDQRERKKRKPIISIILDYMMSTSSKIELRNNTKCLYVYLLLDDQWLLVKIIIESMNLILFFFIMRITQFIYYNRSSLFTLDLFVYIVHRFTPLLYEPIYSFLFIEIICICI
jgi:hypothetical protein